MNPEDLAELLLSRGKVDFILRPGNDTSKLLTINYHQKPGQLLFTCWDPELNIDFCLPNTKTELNSSSVRGVFQQILDRFYVLEQPQRSTRSGGAKKQKADSDDGITLSKDIEHVGKKLTATQIKKINDYIPLAIKGVKIEEPRCIEKPVLKDLVDMLKIGADPNYEFKPSSYDPNQKKMITKAKRSVLQYTLELGKIQHAEVLVEHGANVNVTFVDSNSGSKMSLLMRVLKLPKNEKALAFLQKHGAKLSATELKQLAESVPLAIKGSKIMKPIYVESPKLTNIKTFLEYGVDPNYEFNPVSYDPEKKKQIKKPKRSLLQYALEQENYPVAELLLKKGANVNCVFVDNKGENRSLLHRMINMKNHKGIEILLANGADVNSQVYPNLMTPLHLILLPINNQTAEDVANNIKIAKMLLKHKPNLELTNKIQFKDGPLIESSVIQSAEFLVKKLEGKFQSQKLLDLIKK